MAKKPRILIVTPEVTYLPDAMANQAQYCAKAGGLADVSAALINTLFDLHCDVHVALPDYRSIFNGDAAKPHNKELAKIRKRLDDDRIHLAADRAFYYLNNVYSGYCDKDIKVSLAFQREVINNIIPRVEPDIIHCNDWMTGLIPAMARHMEIPCLFSIHNIHTMTATMAEIEDRGIDAASFWKWFFFRQPPTNYEESRNRNPVDFLTSGVFAAHYVNTVSPSFLSEITDNRHSFVEACLRNELSNKQHAGCATGILNAPEPEFNPAVDRMIQYQYAPNNHRVMKTKNKKYLQKILDIEQDETAVMFFWPSRLDPVQKGCRLITQILHDLMSQYREANLQFVSVANGEYQKHLHDIVRSQGLGHRISICEFNERLSHQAFAASDFVLMPSSYEPCGLPQMIGGIYGSLPVVYDTGGLHDTITQLNPENNTGNGFLFNVHDAGGLKWAIDRAMDFYFLAPEEKEAQINRIMTESALVFNHGRCAEQYIDLYEKMLQRPFL